MTERNDPRRDQGTPGGLGGPEVTPDGGMVLDDGRVQFAPRESDTPGPFVGRGPRGSYPAGNVIADQVCALMTEAGGVDASSIDVHVRGDEVTLEGVVGSEEERRLAENVALAVSTVRAVHNQLRVEGT